MTPANEFPKTTSMIQNIICFPQSIGFELFARFKRFLRFIRQLLPKVKKKNSSKKSIIQDKLIVSSAQDCSILFRRQTHVKKTKKIVFVIKLTIASLNTKKKTICTYNLSKTKATFVFNRQKLKREIDQSETFSPFHSLFVYSLYQ